MWQTGGEVIFWNGKKSGLIFDWYCMVNLCVLFPKSSHKVTFPLYLFIFADMQSDSLQLRAESGALACRHWTLDIFRVPVVTEKCSFIQIWTNLFVYLMIWTTFSTTNIFMGHHLYCCCCELHPYKEENIIYPRIILALASSSAQANIPSSNSNYKQQ